MEVFWDDDTLWTDPLVTWDGTIEITAVRVQRPNVAYALDRLKKNQPKRDKFKDLKIRPQEPEEQEFIKLVCVVDDEIFEKTNYINKKLKVEFLKGEFIVIEAVKSKIEVSNVNLRLEHKTKKEITVTVKNVKIS